MLPNVPGDILSCRFIRTARPLSGFRMMKFRFGAYLTSGGRHRCVFRYTHLEPIKFQYKKKFG